MSLSGPKEQHLGLLLLKVQIHGEDIAWAVIECMDKHIVLLDKSIIGVRKGFIANLK
jgi:hypothetical protein